MDDGQHTDAVANGQFKVAQRLGKFLRDDPRHYQILILSSLLFYGIGGLGFEVDLDHIAMLLGAALATQYLCGQLAGQAAFDPRSSLISGLSLCLLLRTNNLLLAVAAAIIAVASKFVIRWHNKHLFNPTNFAIVVVIGLTGDAWVSPGQWGSQLYFAFLIACLGGLVIHRAMRSDISYAFTAAYAAILFGRAYWLGDPWAIPLRQFQNGALLLFIFFMISDPKTTPDSRIGRVLFAILVAGAAGWVQFGLYRTNGLLWSLAAVSLLTPFIDRLLPGTKYQWRSLILTVSKKEAICEENRLIPRPAARPLG